MCPRFQRVYLQKYPRAQGQPVSSSIQSRHLPIYNGHQYHLSRDSASRHAIESLYNGEQIKISAFATSAPGWSTRFGCPPLPQGMPTWDPNIRVFSTAPRSKRSTCCLFVVVRNDMRQYQPRGEGQFRRPMHLILSTTVN